MVTETVDMEVHVSALNCTSLRGDLETKLKNIHFKKSVSNNYYCCCSDTQLCLTLLTPINCNMPGFPVLHYLPWVCSNSCPLNQWCHPAILSSVVPFSSSLQSFPASWSFPMNQLFASDDQSIGASVSPSVLPMSIQDWFPLGLTGWISL